MTVSAVDALLLLVVGWLCYQVGGLRAQVAAVGQKAIDDVAAAKTTAGSAAALVRSWAVATRRLQERLDILEAKRAPTPAPAPTTTPASEPEKKVTTPEWEPLLSGEMPPMPQGDPMVKEPPTEVGQAE